MCQGQFRQMDGDEISHGRGEGKKWIIWPIKGKYDKAKVMGFQAY